jgi:hypothetical protein
MLASVDESLIHALHLDAPWRFRNQNQVKCLPVVFSGYVDERLDHAGLHESACGKSEFFEQQFARRRRRDQPVDDLPFGSIRYLLVRLGAGAVEKGGSVNRAWRRAARKMFRTRVSGTGSLRSTIIMGQANAFGLSDAGGATFVEADYMTAASSNP